MKIGIFGGAFDPLHMEHLALLSAVNLEVRPDKIILIPTKEPPHKTALIAPFRDRVNMAKAVFGTQFEVSCLEEELGGKNYSLNLATALHARYPKDEILFILGGDSLRDLKIWHKPEALSALVTFVAVPRQDLDDTDQSADFARKEYGAKVIVTQFKGKNLSSSVLKGKLLLGLSVEGEVPAAAINYIQSHGLYRKFSEELTLLRATLSPNLYQHLVSTTLFALAFCSRLQLQFEDVFLAAMFHDVAKEGSFLRVEGVPSAVSHQFYGAEVAEQKYAIHNPQVLEAIRVHTTGKGDMTKLEKLIYVADKLESGRSYPGVEQLRASLNSNFDRGFCQTVAHNYQYLMAAGAQIHPLQEDCFNTYGKGD